MSESGDAQADGDRQLGRPYTDSAGVPADIPPEEALLGAMLRSPEDMSEVLDVVAIDDFNCLAYRSLFYTLRQIHISGGPVNTGAVTERLQSTYPPDVVGEVADLLIRLANSPMIVDVAGLARIVAEQATLRSLISVGDEIARIGTVSGDVAGAVDRAEALVYAVAHRQTHGVSRSLNDLLGQSLDRLEMLHEREDTVTGVPTGFADLDKELLGLQPSNLVILAARPSMGKTAIALGIAAHAAMMARVPVLIFSLEMSQAEVAQRLLCSEARVDLMAIRSGHLNEGDWAKVQDAIGRLGDAPLYVYDRPEVTIWDVKATARRLHRTSGSLGLVIIDYLQLMSGRNSGENRQLEVSEISRGLKVLARELQVPVLALSQLSRNLEMRADKRPALSDLRDSSSLAEDADVIMFIYRDAVYNPDAPDKQSTEVAIAKQRNGPTGIVLLNFIDRQTRFTDSAPERLNK